MVNLTSVESELLLRLYYATEKYQGRKPEYTSAFAGFGVRLNGYSMPTVLRLIQKGLLEKTGITNEIRAVRLTAVGVQTGAKLKADPDALSETVLGYPVRFTRRAYGRGSVQTWASVKVDGQWREVPDPWPGAKWPAKELEQAVLQVVATATSDSPDRFAMHLADEVLRELGAYGARR